jgi:2-isopropylmalate synthase
MANKQIYIYDCSLRRGAQQDGGEFSTADKLAIAEALDGLGVDYVEGGQPGSRSGDDALFAAAPKYDHARLTALSRLQSLGGSAAGDPALTRARSSGARIVTLAGTASKGHARSQFGAEAREYIDMIAESVSHIAGWAEETMFLCGDFFDGFKADAHYALECAATAYIHGARWVVLCDSNGGTLAHEIAEIVEEVAKALPSSHIGIECLNDSGNAVAGSLAAVRAGAHQVHGTFNALGVRCGNADLAVVIPNLVLKMGFEAAVTAEKMSRLSAVSQLVDARLNQPSQTRTPFVGAQAFSHGEGLYGAAMAATVARFEHIDPQAVGNQRRIASEEEVEQGNYLARLAALGLAADGDDPATLRLIETLQENERDGLDYGGADASFELLARKSLGTLPNFFRLDSFRVIDERRIDPRGNLVTLSEASVRVQVGQNRHMMVAEGAGPVHALDVALRKALADVYPALDDLRLIDYKVRILNSEGGTKARIRVMIDSTDGVDNWSTVGVSDNVIDASYSALHDGIVYKLLRDDLKRQANGGN